MFASPGNKKITQFVSCWPHWQAKQIDALNCPFEGLGGLYANSSWSVIANWPQIKTKSQCQCLILCPYWVSATWWPQLIKLKVPKTPCLVIRAPPKFTDRGGSDTEGEAQGTSEPASKVHDLTRTNCWARGVKTLFGMFTNCHGCLMPPPKWPLICMLC